MASFRKPAVNKQPKNAFVNNGANNIETKFKTRTGVVVPNRIFVGGICPTANENDLLNLFGKYGVVKAIKIVNDQNGSSKGYGFVTFEKADDVSRLQNDAKNLVINDRRLNIAPAVMKNPPYVSRYSDSYVMPITPNIYFTNNLQYQYQDGNGVYPNGTYAPQLTVVPAVSDAAYYPNNYGIPTTPYQGAALFYPVSHNASQVMVGPQSYSSYQPIVSNNSNYVYSSPVAATPTSPQNTSAKNTSTVTTATNTPEIHGPHGTPMITAVPPNVSTLPPPLPYQLSHPPQYYNGSVVPSYAGEVYYNMIHGACYPMMTINGQESYIPYYDVGESCNNGNNISAEESNYESQPIYQTNMNGMPTYGSEKSSKDSSPVSHSISNNNNNNNSTNNNNNINNEGKQIVLAVPPPAAEHGQDHSYSPDSNGCNSLATSGVQTPQPNGVDYNSTSTFVQHHRSTAIIYPNTPIPQPNIYFSSVYMTEATSSSLAQCPYSKNLSDNYVSDHLPKRDSKYSQKKFPISPNKDAPPNIPKFPYFVNNNFPGFVNRNVKDKDYKDYKNANGKNVESKTPQRPPRSNANAVNLPPKPRIFHNQNQYGPPPRSQRNGHVMSPNVQYHPRSAVAMSKQNSYEQPQQSPYEYQNNYHGHATYPKNMNYDHHRRYGQNSGSGYRGKYDRSNMSANDTSYLNKNVTEDRCRKYQHQQEESVVSNNERIQLEQNVTANGNQQLQQQQQVCLEMQNLTL